MRYVTYQLLWLDNYGFGPEDLALEHASQIVASSFSIGEFPQKKILSYLHGDVDVSLFSAYEMNQLTQTEALEMASLVNSDVFVDEDGALILPPQQIAPS